MCLAVPVKLTKIVDAVTAEADSGGVTVMVDISLLADPAPGDYVIVHAGFALEKLQASEAEATLDLLEELGETEGGGS